jgi:hypothetical protein
MSRAIPNPATNSILTTSAITSEALKILEQNMRMQELTPHCLVSITLKDGTSQELIIKMRPGDIHEIGADLKKCGGVTLSNEESAILVMADQVKHINVMRITSKE